MAWLQRWRNVFRSEPLNDELDAELEYHLAETADALSAAGMNGDEARRVARLRLGNYSIQKERTRDMNVALWLDEFRADLAYGLRQLKLSPGFTAIALLSLTLGIGANTAIFQLVNAMQLKMLPVHDPAQLVSVDFAKESTRPGWWPSRGATMNYAVWEQIQARQQAFSSVLAWSNARFNLTTGGEPRFAEGLYVSGDFFRALGIGAIAGRTLSKEDDGAACNAGAVISDSFWQREFAGERGVIGKAISLDGHSVPILGVTPPSFFGLEVGHQYDVAIPLCADRLFNLGGEGRIAHGAWWLAMMGRLKPGWTLAAASSNVRAISGGVMRETVPTGYNPKLAKGYLANRLVATDGGTGVSGLRRQYERSLWLLMCITGLVLLIACANLANLLLARAAVREPEIAVRLAIGASRWRLVRQFLTESLLLAAAGTALGAGLAMFLARALVGFISTANNRVLLDLTFDLRSLAFTAALAALTCLLFGLLPAVRATYSAPAAAMRTGSRGVTTGRERINIRRLLVAAQVALSLVLLFGALLFVRSLHNLLTVDAGFQAEGILGVPVDFRNAPYPKERRMTVYRELSDRLSNLPGVVSTAQVDYLPVLGGTWDNLVAVNGAAANGSGCFFNQAGPNYFHTMKTRLIAGRDFNERDTPASRKVAVVNEVFARKFFGDASPIGHTFRMAADAGKPEPLFEIVGLVANTKYGELREDFRPIAVFPIGQSENPSTHTMFVLRTVGSGGPLIKAAKASIKAMDPSIEIEFVPLSTQLKESLLREQLMAALMVGFGVLAGLLAVIGLYGVIAYMVARRRHEIGLRIALGADRVQVFRLVLNEALTLVGIGLGLGMVLALWAGRATTALLFGLPAYDFVSLLAAVGVLVFAGFLASCIPAWRAATLDPTSALRAD